VISLTETANVSQRCQRPQTATVIFPAVKRRASWALEVSTVFNWRAIDAGLDLVKVGLFTTCSSVSMTRRDGYLH
jgi:hypothetical protein